MNNIISKLFNLTKKLNQKELSFQKIKNSTKILKIFQSISSHNEWSEVRYVGGCVRKILNNENYDDIDLATNLDPQQIKECLSSNNIKFFETGIKHGTITATIEKQNFEITSLRKDIATDGRHAEVLFTKDWNEDSSRRDFTINSIYADIDGNIFDPNDGANDLKNGIVRFIGNPEKRIKEDYLRILRYLRFFSTYSLKDHQPEIKKSIMQNISGVVGLSKERLLDEFKKIFKSGALFKLNKDHFSNDVISLVFPQFINLNLLTKLDKNNQKTLLVKSFDFLLAFLVIDETDNSDYFLYKFKTSNETKKKIIFLKKSFLESAEKNYFSKKNLEKIFYFNEKSDALDLIDFELFKLKTNKKKLIELKNYFIKTEKPVFPVKAKNIMEKFDLKEGRELGQKLKYLEDLWVNNSFNISDKEIEKTFQG